MSNTAEFEFSIGDYVIDDVQGGYIEVIGQFRSHGINNYECTTQQGYIIYRSENDLLAKQE